MSLEFIKAYESVLDYTLLTPDRCWHLWRLARTVAKIPGDMVECGTYKGGSAKLLSRAVAYGKNLHVFDTFTGIPGQQREEGEHSPGDFSWGEEKTRRFLEDCKNISIYCGLVPDILEKCLPFGRFNFVYLDMDLFIPTLAALHFCWQRLESGGCVVLDDVDNLDGIVKAINIFTNQYSGQFRYTKTTTDQCVFYKI